MLPSHSPLPLLLALHPPNRYQLAGVYASFTVYRSCKHLGKIGLQDFHNILRGDRYLTSPKLERKRVPFAPFAQYVAAPALSDDVGGISDSITWEETIGAFRFLTRPISGLAIHFQTGASTFLFGRCRKFGQ